MVVEVSGTVSKPYRRAVVRLLAVYREAFQGLSREVWILSLVLFINRCGSMVLPFLVLYLTSRRGYTASEAGEVLAAYGVGAIFGIGAGGWLTDRIGFRVVQVVSMALSGLGFIGFSFLVEPPAVLAGGFGLGLLAESFRPANGSALAAFSPPHLRARAFGLNRLALNLGWTIGPAFGGFLAEVDFKLLFWIDGATCLLAALGLVVMLPASTGPGERADREANEQAAHPAGSPWRDRIFMLAFGFLLLQCLVFFQLQSTYTLYLVEARGFSTRVVGVMIAVNTVLIVLFEMPLVKSIEHRDPLKMIALASLCVALGFGLLPLSGSLVWIVFLALLWTLGEMLTSPTMSGWVANRAGPGSRGAYMAAFGIAFSVAFALGPWLGTRVYERFGPDWLWWGCLVVGAVSATGFRALARHAQAR